jgi:tight adherence protein C
MLTALMVFMLALVTGLLIYRGLTTAPKRFAPVRRSPAPFDSTSSLARRSFGWGDARGSFFSWWLRRASGLDPDKPEAKHLLSALSWAGFETTGPVIAIYRAIRIAAVLMVVAAGIVIASFYPRWRIPAVLGGAVVGYLMPGRVLKRLGHRRQRKIMRELPWTLDLLVVSLEAGLGLIEAIKVVGRETTRLGQELGKELSTAAAEMGAGVSVDNSLHSLGDRTGLDDVKAAAVLVQSRQIGGRMGPALRASAELLMTKRRLRAEEAAQKSSVKMLLPLVLFILPAMMIVIVGPAAIQIFQLMFGARL